MWQCSQCPFAENSDSFLACDCCGAARDATSSNTTPDEGGGQDTPSQSKVPLQATMNQTEIVEPVMVEVVAQFPPRPDAIITLVASDYYLPGAQTLLYSIQKTLDTSIPYSPELVVLVTPDVSQETRSALCPALCTRIIEVPLIPLPSGGIHKKVVTAAASGNTNSATKEHSPWDQDCPGLTKLHAFKLVVYDTIVFVEPDCLVLDDLYPLIKKGKVYTESEALVAAAPDLFPPDRFNSGVMVIRPSQTVFDNMMAQRSLLINATGDDTGFLNAYYSEWHTAMAPLARLPFTYNAQRALYDMTYHQGHRNYWDLAISPDLKIIHYSGIPKPWDMDSKLSAAAVSKDDSNDKTSKGDYLTLLWRQWYQRSKNYVIRIQKEQEKEQVWKASEQVRKRQLEQQAAAQQQQKANPKHVHKTVAKRFKELRKEGHSPKDAMAMARAENGLNDEQSTPAAVNAQVASMFGIMM